jgi:fibronectin type 3 domain-containing protein
MKKLVIFLIGLLILTGCANKVPLKSDPHLPTVKKFNAYPDRNAMALRWSIVPNIKGYYIERYNDKEKKWQLIATINNPFKSIYVDTNLKPNTIYKYKIATFNKSKIPSLALQISQKTLPTISPVIPLEIRPLKKGTVKIIFRPHLNERVNGYIIQRFNDKTSKWEDLTTLHPRFNVEYIDSNLEDGKIYKYRIIATTFDNLKSIPSKTMAVITYPKPPVITNISASINLPKKIKLTWSPVKNAAYYKVYAKSFLGYKLIAKTKNTYYIDKINKNGYQRYYKVTAVSKYGTESMLNHTPEVMGETLPIPATPIVATNIIGNKVELIFSSPDNRAVKYLVIKKDSPFSKGKKFIVKSQRFVDSNLKPKHTYTYIVYAIDKYNLISKPQKVEVKY